MSRSLEPADTERLRQALKDLPAAAAHPSAARPPALDELYAPDSHEVALDPDRALVVGNRGVGKSFWSAVLADPKARARAAEFYRRLRLDSIEVVLGFHEAAGKVEGPAPSPEILASLLAEHKSEQIWRGVLVLALGPRTGLEFPPRLRELLPWIGANLEDVEAGLRHADQQLQGQRKRFVLLFDALDRLGGDWETIRRLSEGLLRFALDLRGYRSIRAKLFMRSDQARDERLYRFPDASKLRAESVELKWQRRDLYGLLYRRLWFHNDPAVQRAFRGVAVCQGAFDDSEQLPTPLKNDEDLQRLVFEALAGPYMGSNHRRGKTFSWLYGHLADAFGETSPRSFLIALQRAAHSANSDLPTVLDHHAIRSGVQEASRVRLDQLKEDYAWIGEVLQPLAGLEVPCAADNFIERWRQNKTVQTIHEFEEREQQLGPLELADNPKVPEEALLLALENIGVLERRVDGRINAPDIFRVAATMKRRGGVPPVNRR